MDNRNRRIGIILSYLMIVLNSAITVILTPFMINLLGDNNYGLYQLMTSFVAYLAILNGGIGVIIARYTSQYKLEKNKESIENFFAIAHIIVFLLGVLILIIGIGIYLNLDIFLNKTLNNLEIMQARQMFIVSLITFIITTFENAISGINSAYERYIFNQLIRIFKIILRSVLIIVFLKIFKNAMTIVYIDLIIIIGIFLIEYIYVYSILKIKPKLVNLDKEIFLEILSFTSIMFLQAMAYQANLNVDKIILGITMGTSTVAIYTISSNIYTIFRSFTIPDSFYISKVTNIIVHGDDKSSLDELAISVGRKVFIILSWILVGFCLCGRDFILLWVGEQYEIAWLISLIIMLSMCIPQSQSICVCILTGYKKRKFRSFVMFLLAFINIIITFELTKKIGILGAPIGTAFATIIGEVVIMNIYYKKYIGLNIEKILANIFLKTLICSTISIIVSYFIVKNMGISWELLIVKASIITFIHFTIIFVLGLNKEEKNIIINLINKYKITQYMRKGIE